MEHIYDHHRQRMESIAPVYQMTICFGRKKWSSFGIYNEDDDLKLNLLMGTLEIIYMYHMSGRDCTINEISDELAASPKEYGLNIKGRELEFAEFIIDTLMHGDKGEFSMRTKIINYDGGDTSEYFVSLITTVQQYPNGRDGKEKTLYKLSRIGMNFFLSTNEVMGNLMYTIDQIRLGEEIKHKNYGSALSLVHDVKSILLNYDNSVAIARREIAKDIYGYAAQEYNAIHNGINQTLKKAHEEFDAHTAALITQRNDFLANNMEYDTMPEEIKNNLKMIDTLKQEITECYAITLRVLKDISTMSQEYIEAAKKYMTIRSANRLSIEQDIMTAIKQKPYLLGLEGVSRLLHPLFLKDPEKIYNPLCCYDDQYPTENKEQTDDYVIDINPEEDLSAARREREETVSRVRHIMHQIFVLAMQDNGVTLTDIIKIRSVNNLFNEQISADCETLKNVLIFFGKCINTPRHIAEDISHIKYSEGSIEPESCYIEIMKVNDAFANIKKLVVEKSANRVSFDHIYDKRDNRYVRVSCDDYIIRLLDEE